MSSGIDDLKKLKKVVAKIAKEMHLDLSIFNLVLGSEEEEGMLQIIFAINAEALKSQEEIETEFFNTQFEQMLDGLTESESETIDNSNEDDTIIIDDIKSWLEEQ